MGFLSGAFFGSLKAAWAETPAKYRATDARTALRIVGSNSVSVIIFIIFILIQPSNAFSLLLQINGKKIIIVFNLKFFKY